MNPSPGYNFFESLVISEIKIPLITQAIIDYLLSSSLKVSSLMPISNKLTI